MVSTRGGGQAPRARAGAPRAAKAARVAPAPPASKVESDGLPLSDEICDALLESLAAVDVRSVAVLLCVCRRFYRLGASNASLWRNAVLASPYADLLPRLDATWLLASDRPHLLVARLFSRRCAYCEQPGEYWFTVQGRRVCRGCFELDIPQEGDTRTTYPVTELSAFLTIAPAAAGAGAAATGVDDARAGGSADGAAAGALAPAAVVAAQRRPPLCAYMSRPMAKTLFCLSDREVNSLRSLKLTGDDVYRGGGISSKSSITLVTAGDCLAAAVARYGSQAALAEEAASRRADALSARNHQSPYVVSRCNVPHLNQSRDGAFTFKIGMGLEHAVRSPFFTGAGGRLLRVGTPGTATAAGADFLSFAAAHDAAKAGDVIELLPGTHDADVDYEDDEEDIGGLYITKSITVIGRPGANGERPRLVGSLRVLVVVYSCVIHGVAFQSLQPVHLGNIPTVLVCSLVYPSDHRMLHVEFENCELRVPNQLNVQSVGLLARVQNGAPAGRTRVVLKSCVSGRVSHTDSVELLTDGACDIDEIVLDDQ